MKVSKVTYPNSTKKILKNFKYTVALLPFIAGIQTLSAQNTVLPQDTYQTQDSLVTPSGIDITALISAPSPNVKIGNDTLCVSIVVDVSKNILYLYDDFGSPQKAYKIASGKKTTPTHVGVRKIINIEKYPYSNAPASSKRHLHPADYGPKILVLRPVDITNGEFLPNDGQFIHGNNNPSSIGNWASKGCIRMDNNAIKEVAKYVQQGQYVSIIR